MEIVFGYWNYFGTRWDKDDVESHIKYGDRPLCNPSFNRPDLIFVATDECAKACQICLKIFISGDMPDVSLVNSYPKLRLGI